MRRILCCVVAAVALASCGSGDTSPAESTPAFESEIAGAYAYLGKDDAATSTIWDPLLLCGDDPPCDPAGMLPGIALALSTRDGEGGWGVKLAFDPEVSSDDRVALVERLAERARNLGLVPPVALGPGDPWPSCADKPDCLTVSETLTNG